MISPGENVQRPAVFEAPAASEATFSPPVALELIFDEHGSLPDAHLMANFGITSEEGRQVVKYGDYEGTVAQMLSGAPDPATGKVCPVGGMVRAKHAEKGVEGTKEAFKGMEMMGAEVSHVNFSDKTPADYDRARQAAQQVVTENLNSKKK